MIFTDRDKQKHCVFELAAGNHFGCSHLLQVASYEFFGEIKAVDDCEIVVIERADTAFELYERSILQSLV